MMVLRATEASYAGARPNPRAKRALQGLSLRLQGLSFKGLRGRRPYYVRCLGSILSLRVRVQASKALRGERWTSGIRLSAWGWV